MGDHVDHGDHDKQLVYPWFMFFQISCNESSSLNDKIHRFCDLDETGIIITYRIFTKKAFIQLINRLRSIIQFFRTIRL